MIRNILKIVVSVGLLLLLATRLEWRDVLVRAMHLSWWSLPLALALQVSVWALSNVRWWLLIRVHDLGHTYRDLLRPTYIGALFNNVLPSSTGGDLFRMYHVYRQGHGAAVAVSPIITERVVGLLVMIAFAAVAIHGFGGETALFHALRVLLLWLLAVGTAGLIIVSLPATYRPIRGLLARWEELRPVAGLLGITDAIHTYLSRRGLVSALVGVSLLLQGIQVLIFAILGAGVDATLPLSQYLFIVPVILVAASIPVSVGGLGVREAAAVTLFTSAGMSSGHAAAVSLLYIPVLLLSAVPGLWFFLSMKEHRQFYRKATATDFRNN